MARIIANSQEFFTRYLFTVIMIFILWQLYVPIERIVKAYNEKIALGTKNKFFVSV